MLINPLLTELLVEIEAGSTMKRMLSTAMAASRVCFLTDMEGNWQYVRNVVRHSACLRFRDAQERELELQDDCLLVFGGDGGDKGDNTLHCYGELVRLKKQHPDRVVLLVGNRDVNKMRFTSELHDSQLDLATMAPQIREGPVWVPEERRMTIPKFLAKKATEAAAASSAAAVDDTQGTCEAAEPPDLTPFNTKVNRLHWMLSYTMGSHGDFEQRLRELNETNDAVRDEDVVESFHRSVDKGGVLREFLKLGSLAFISHKTLFVHGGIISPAASTTEQDILATNALGRVPQDPKIYEDIHEWVDKLNAWYRGQVQEWLDQPMWSEDRLTRGGNELLEYVLYSYKHSVVMGRHLDKSGMPVPLPKAIAKSLQDNGITRLVVGHTPHGTCPTVIKQPEVKDPNDASLFQEVIMCDTSYSDMTSPDNRGIAASELVLHADGHAEIHGVLENGRPIDFSTNCSYVGRLLRDGMRVKAKPADANDEFLVFKVENGFTYTYNYRSLDELLEIGFVDEEEEDF